RHYRPRFGRTRWGSSDGRDGSRSVRYDCQRPQAVTGHGRGPGTARPSHQEYLPDPVDASDEGGKSASFTRMPPLAGDQLIATILKHDNKTTSYKIALLRALNDLVLSYPGLAQYNQSVAVPLVRLAELWVAYYWPFMDEQQPIYQGARAQLGTTQRHDVSFRPALTHLRAEWQRALQLVPEAADGFFLLT
nr:hypothetical protein [Tanacetum cinerariifolium]